jgi:glycine cleavage system H lipoate-binding protein
MSNIPQDLRYTTEHGWVRSLSGQILELGVTEHGQDPYGKGWLVTLHMADPAGLSALLTPTAYEALVKSDGG